jgi:hypothetical protein
VVLAVAAALTGLSSALLVLGAASVVVAIAVRLARPTRRAAVD